MSDQIVVTVEGGPRRRVSLGRVVKNPAKFYLVEEQPDGVIVLHPAEVVDARLVRTPLRGHVSPADT